MESESNVVKRRSTIVELEGYNRCSHFRSHKGVDQVIPFLAIDVAVNEVEGPIESSRALSFLLVILPL